MYFKRNEVPILSFCFSVLSRVRRDDQVFIGVQRLYIEFQLNFIICGANCRAPEYIRRLIGYLFDVTFIYDGKSCSFKGVCDFAPTSSK
jgi:hypothetical protein